MFSAPAKDHSHTIVMGVNQETYDLSVLAAVDRKPNVSGFGIEDLGVQLAQRGGHSGVAGRLEAKVSGIYACSGVIGSRRRTAVRSLASISLPVVLATWCTTAWTWWTVTIFSLISTLFTAVTFHDLFEEAALDGSSKLAFGARCRRSQWS